MQLLLDGAPVFEKTRFSACLPQVGEILKQKRIANVVLAGAETHICMLQTVLDLRAAGLSAKDTAALVAKHTGANKKAVYQYLLDNQASRPR